MSSDKTTDVPAVSTREAVREKALHVQAKQARARMIRQISAGGLAVVAVAAIGFGVYAAIGSETEAPNREPLGMTLDGVTVSALVGPAVAGLQAQPSLPDANSGAEADPEVEGEGEAEPEQTDVAPDAEPTSGTPAPGSAGTEQPVAMHIYVDYLSPGAGAFQRANAAQISRWIEEGAVTVTYHPVALLTASSNGTKYSLRAAGAAACVASYSPEQFSAYNHELLISQPDVDSDGYSDTELADLAVAVGISNVKTVRTCIEERHFVSWAKTATTRAVEGPLPGTTDTVLSTPPMVVVGGQTYVGAQDNAAEFSQFVLTVASDAYYSSSTPAPVPSATPSPTGTSSGD